MHTHETQLLYAAFRLSVSLGITTIVVQAGTSRGHLLCLSCYVAEVERTCCREYVYFSPATSSCGWAVLRVLAAGEMLFGVYSVAF